MADVVGGTEDEVEGNVLVLVDVEDRIIVCLQVLIGTWRRSVTREQYCASMDGVIAYLTVGCDHVGLIHEELSFMCGEGLPIPEVDGIVAAVFGLTKLYLARFTQLLRCAARVDGIVGIEIGLNIQQRHLTVGGRGDGQRDADDFAVGVRRAGVCGDILVVDIDGTLDEPVVGGHTVGFFVT